MTLVEVLIDLVVLSLVATAVFSLFNAGAKSIKFSRQKAVAVTIANQHMEQIRALPYNEVGTTTGAPRGIIESSQTVSRPDGDYRVETEILYVDDSADGTLAAGTDVANYDYKQITVKVYHTESSRIIARIISDMSSPVAETQTDTGAFQICVQDSLGQPVVGSMVQITNPDLDEGALSILREIENGNGCIDQFGLYESDTPYQITAYYDDAVWSTAEVEYSVIVQQVQQIALTIDKWRTITLSAKSLDQQPIANMELNIAAISPSTASYTKSGDGTGQILFTTTDRVEANNYRINTATTATGSVTWYPVFSDICEPWDMITRESITLTTYFTQNSGLPQRICSLPSNAYNGEVFNLSIYGLNLSVSSSVKLLATGGGEMVGNIVSFDEDSDDRPGYGQLSVDFNPTGAPLGRYNLEIGNSVGTVLLNNLFELKDANE
jgi:type II secretory pathway pseudopilin PulG